LVLVGLGGKIAEVGGQIAEVKDLASGTRGEGRDPSTPQELHFVKFLLRSG